MLNNPWVQNVASEFIALALLLLAGMILYHFTHRRRLLRFFNLIGSKTITVYVSNLSIPLGGASDADGVRRSYTGGAIPEYEIYLLPVFQRLFNLVIPSVDTLPGFLRWLLISDVTVNVVPSPLGEGEIERASTLIAIGSPGFNSASRRIERRFNAPGSFIDDNQALQLGDAPPVTDPRCAFVQRAVDSLSGQVAFYVAGPASTGTTGAAYYLAREWRRLDRRFPGGRPFCVMLRITSEDARQHEVLFER